MILIGKGIAVINACLDGARPCPYLSTFCHWTRQGWGTGEISEGLEGSDQERPARQPSATHATPSFCLPGLLRDLLCGRGCQGCSARYIQPQTELEAPEVPAQHPGGGPPVAARCGPCSCPVGSIYHDSISFALSPRPGPSP